MARTEREGRGRHRRGLGHRARPRAAVRGGRGRRWPSPTADAERGKRVAAEIAASGGQHVFVEAHMKRESEAAAFVRQAADRFGRLDVLVNNAGIGSITPWSTPAPRAGTRSSA
jgi:NAD(P)-dependent dehydrogenase (short-subunit alcohol dehydrogenase family)